MDKTVYILGAGFSVPAGAPSQVGIMAKIWDLRDNPDIEPHKEKLRTFLHETLNVDETKVTLEDIYTPIDRCLSDGIGLRGASSEALREIRDSLGHLISSAILESLNSASVESSSYVSRFAEELVKIASRRAELAKGTEDASEAKAYDPFAVISLNWDILLDNALNSKLEKRDGGSFNDYDPFGVVDYCCYISSLESSERRIRTGLWSLGCRGYNVKLLKIHGSMNWLQCSNCQQLFVAYNRKLTLPNFDSPQSCRHCQKQDNESKLRGALLMPTFLKDLTNFQVKLVWQNAAIEIMEARKLVFIGYSLPHADFEFRQLLSRMVHKDAEIEVVLWEGEEEEGKLNYQEECKRYKDFFSKHQLVIDGKGAEHFVDKFICEETPRD